MRYYPIRTFEERVAQVLIANPTRSLENASEYVRARDEQADSAARKHIWREYADSSIQDFGYVGTDIMSAVKKMFEPQTQDTSMSFVSPYAVLLTGMTGCGKTRAMHAVLLWLLANDPERVVLFKSYTEFLDEIRTEFSDGAHEDFGASWGMAINHENSYPGVIMLDDIGSQKPTDFELEKLYAILNYRLSNYEPMLLSTNVPEDKWDTTFGQRVASRLRRFTTIKMPDYDFRANF